MIDLSTSCARSMSTTMPLVSSSRAMNAASITNVAPCIACAGPNTAPLNEWAIMMWSRTSRVNMQPLCVIDALAEHATAGCQDARQFLRQVGEFDRWRQQGVKPCVGEQGEGGGEA